MKKNKKLALFALDRILGANIQYMVHKVLIISELYYITALNIILKFIRHLNQHQNTT